MRLLQEKHILQRKKREKLTLNLDLTGISRKNTYKYLIRNFNLSLRKPLQWSLKRSFDYCSTLFGLTLISPLLALVAILIKLDSKGPVFYKQKRIGLYGKEFEMYKFRSMRQDADKEYEKLKQLNETNELMFKVFNDPRITRVGKFIRKYSIDELPQLFNVLKGEMSLVGPRPPLPREVQHYEKRHYLRFATLPGLTGLWQVSGRSKIKEFDTVLQLDFSYINRWSFLMDIGLLFKTIPVVLFAKNAA